MTCSFLVAFFYRTMHVIVGVVKTLCQGHNASGLCRCFKFDCPQVFPSLKADCVEINQKVLSPQDAFALSPSNLCLNVAT